MPMNFPKIDKLGLSPMGPVGAEILGALKEGGEIKRTGNYRLHKGEEVIPARKRRGRGGMPYARDPNWKPETPPRRWRRKRNLLGSESVSEPMVSEVRRSND